MKSTRGIFYVIGLFFLFVGCDGVEDTSKNEQNIGYFVTTFNSSVDYDCEHKRQKLDESGKFECASFPISFYVRDEKLGEISSIHSDGYVYPQDILFLEDRVPVYTSDNSMSFLAIE